MLDEIIGKFSSLVADFVRNKDEMVEINETWKTASDDEKKMLMIKLGVLENHQNRIILGYSFRKFLAVRVSKFNNKRC